MEESSSDSKMAQDQFLPPVHLREKNGDTKTFSAKFQQLSDRDTMGWSSDSSPTLQTQFRVRAVRSTLAGLPQLF